MYSRLGERFHSKSEHVGLAAIRLADLDCMVEECSLLLGCSLPCRVVESILLGTRTSRVVVETFHLVFDTLHR